MRIRKTVIAVVAGVALAGCGSASSSSNSAGGGSTVTSAGGSSVTTASSASAQAFNDNDVQFAQDMIAHHEQAITMADMALDAKAGASAQVVALAQQIKMAQGPEVAKMTGWLSQWGQSVTTMPMSGSHDMGSGHDMGSMGVDSVPGMMSAEAMNKLMGLKGKAFDQAWLQMMIEHHQGAISMSQAVKKDGSNKDVAALADQIITAQQAEVTKMTTMLNS